MLRFARWHIWLGWLVGVPILMWTVTGLFMVARPIDQVRGETLRVERPDQPLPPGALAPLSRPATGAAPVREVRTAMQRGAAVTTVTFMDGTNARYDAASGAPLPPVTAAEARAVAAQEIRSSSPVASVQLFAAGKAPGDFRKPVPAWRVALEDGTHVYIGQHSGAIEAVRTRWWRAFDVMWGLHTMDLKTREDTSHPVLILFAALAALGALLGCVLMFRRRKPPRAAR